MLQSSVESWQEGQIVLWLSAEEDAADFHRGRYASDPARAGSAVDLGPGDGGHAALQALREKQQPGLSGLEADLRRHGGHRPDDLHGQRNRFEGSVQEAAQCGPEVGQDGGGTDQGHREETAESADFLLGQLQQVRRAAQKRQEHTGGGMRAEVSGDLEKFVLQKLF